MSTLTPNRETRSTERRTGIDRRQKDLGPAAGTAERRRRPDPRKPEVAELQLSDHEWELTFGRLRRQSAREPDGRS
ncbi:MAG: hypothetical protein J0M28_09410 [Thauera sp.]|nr:hypothetical protein [Thauera sp.]